MCQHLRGHALRIGTVVTDQRQLRVVRQPVLQQGILVAVEPVLRDLQRHGRSEEGDAAAALLDEVVHRIIGTHIVIDHHATGVHPRTDTIVEHQGHPRADQFQEMVVLFRVLRLRDDDAAHLVLIERLADTHLSLIALLTRGHQQAVAARRGLLLDTGQHRGKVIVHEVGDDDADELLGLHLTEAQRLGDAVRREVVLSGVGLNDLSPLLTDAGRVLQRTRHGGHGDSELPGNVLHRHWHMLFHQVSNYRRCKDTKNSRHRHHLLYKSVRAHSCKRLHGTMSYFLSKKSTTYRKVSYLCSVNNGLTS